MPIEILFTTDGEKSKAQGVFMPKEENDIPQIVGLSKKQFFGFFIAALLMGAGMFGIGYTLAYFKKSTNQTEYIAPQETANQNKKNKYGKIIKALDNEYLDGKISTLLNSDSNENIESQAKEQVYYVTLGVYKNENEGQKLIATLSKLGKTGHIKQSENGYILYLGPYNSLSLAQNEIDSIYISSSLSGSITQTLN
jgi:hypothetical protein